MSNRVLFVLFLVACVLSKDALAAPMNPIPATKPSSEVKIDGKVDVQSEWKDVPSFEGMRNGMTGTEVALTAKFWIACDDKYVYFAAIMQDDKPKSITAYQYQTNVSLAGDDRIILVLDPKKTYNSFNAFSINPRGATNIQIAGGRAAKREWLGDFQAAARITESGWEAEARIPWEIMRLPKAGKADMLFNVERYVPRLQQSHIWTYVTPQNTLDFPVLKDVEVPAVSQNSIKLLPYNYVGSSKGKTLFNSGLDVRSGLGETLEVVGTINPDFRNIENQILSLDFSYFERLAGESRPFFQEGDRFFETSRDTPIFRSQRIQDLDAGVKLTGTLNNHEVGLLSTTDFDQNTTLVGRYLHRLSPRSNFLLSSAYFDGPGGKNTASFFSSNYGTGAYVFYGQYSSTDDWLSGQGHRINAGFNNFSTDKRTEVEYIEITDDYLPRLGFLREGGYRGVVVEHNANNTRRRGSIIEAGYGIGAEFLNKFNGDLYRKSLRFNTSTTLQDGTDIDTYVEHSEFRGHLDEIYSLSWERPRGNPYNRIELQHDFGKLAGLPFKNYLIRLPRRISQPLQLNAQFQRFEYAGEKDDQYILTAVYDLKNDQSINTRIVVRDTDVNAYFAYRKSGNKGIEYFLIVGNPNARKFENSIILKMTVPMEIK